MRKFLVGFLFGVCLTYSLFALDKSSIYSRSAKVVGLNYDTDIVTVKDTTGNVWTFEGIEDYELCDKVALTMSDSWTEWTITDDRILSVRYDG